MFKRLLSYPSVQIALCAAVFALIGYRLGASAAVLTSPLLAAAIARPVMNLIANFRHNVRAHVLLPVHGQHYAFKGITIHVIEDDDRCRWIPLADVRKVAGMTANDGALAVTYPERFARMGSPPQPHLRDDALVEHLGKENNPVALRFRTWVERDVIFPGRRIRKGLGIRPEPAYSDA
jgi:hypothetical protein